MKPDILKALEPVVAVFEDMLIKYAVGGSIASSLYGTARATLDVDLVADVKLQHVPELVRTLEADYYIDEQMIKTAIRRRASFNLIHLETMMKIDVFLIKDNPYEKKAFTRRRRDVLDEERPNHLFYISSPEDIILKKLEWYRKGDMISERQWNDVLGVLKVQRDNLDIDYLVYWASELDLSELMEKAFKTAGLL